MLIIIVNFEEVFVHRVKILYTKREIAKIERNVIAKGKKATQIEIFFIKKRTSAKAKLENFVNQIAKQKKGINP